MCCSAECQSWEHGKKKKIYIADHLRQKFQTKKKSLAIQLAIRICEFDENITQKHLLGKRQAAGIVQCSSTHILEEVIVHISSYAHVKKYKVRV